MTHDPLCPHRPETLGVGGPAEAVLNYQAAVSCQCDLIAKVRADEQAKYVLPDLPRGGDHVDWCRDLACCGCEEIADGVIAQML